MRDVEALKAELREAGAWVFAGGLHAPSTATVVRVKDDEMLTTDGPYIEGKEHIGGFTVIQAPDLDAALEWGRKLARATTLPIETESRRAARTGPDGDLVLLADQDRGRWDHGLIAEGHALVRRCLRRNQPGPYQIQAAINSVHSNAPTAAVTDWRQILQLYDQLLSFDPSPVVALNRAVAVAEVRGPEEALALVDSLTLDRFHVFHAVRAELLRRLDRNAEAGLAYDKALARTENAAERDFLRRGRQALPGESGGRGRQ
ncbi:DUF6596 domain-containing protein [Streptomyces decoyicus]|nr:DUF6596 domain-containing protein [Streptomyces decoyicus]